MRILLTPARAEYSRGLTNDPGDLPAELLIVIVLRADCLHADVCT
jgi:hypothetical protein